jgi:hypothetical protein
LENADTKINLRTVMEYCTRKISELTNHSSGELTNKPTEQHLNQPTRVLTGSRDSSVGIATGYGLDDRGVGVRVPVGSRIFSSPRRPHGVWGPPSLLSNGYWGLFPRG